MVVSVELCLGDAGNDNIHCLVKVLVGNGLVAESLELVCGGHV